MYLPTVEPYYLGYLRALYLISLIDEPEYKRLIKEFTDGQLSKKVQD